MARNGDENLDALLAEKSALETKLASVATKIREAEIARRDAGKPTLIAAINRVKVAEMSRDDAKVIAATLAKHGGETVAQWLKQADAKAGA